MSGLLAYWPLLPACLATGLASWWATLRVTELLLASEIMDRPVGRSSHDAPKPRGAGLAVIPVVFLAWIVALVWLAPTPAGFLGTVLGLALVAGVSWRDDVDSLPARVRLAVQALAVVVGLLAFGDPARIFQGWLPGWAAWPLAALAWLWFVNLFNFMDGIDGITGVQSLALGLGIALVAALGALESPLVALPALLAAAAGGFLVLNWHPAKVFLGDVGSVSLGYLLGWLLLVLAAEGAWAAALILPAYYLGDATITLVRRAIRREKVWEAHKQHFYQRAVAAGASHDRVAGAVAGCNLVLVCLAAFSLQAPLAALLAALATVGVFLFCLGRIGA